MAGTQQTLQTFLDMKPGYIVAGIIICLVLSQIFKEHVAIMLFGSPDYLIGTGAKARTAKAVIWYFAEDVIILLLASEIRKRYGGTLGYFWVFMVGLAIGKIVDEFLRPYGFSVEELRWILICAYMTLRYYFSTKIANSKLIKWFFALKKE